MVAEHGDDIFRPEAELMLFLCMCPEIAKKLRKCILIEEYPPVTES